jgi:hypothetical protein
MNARHPNAWRLAAMLAACAGVLFLSGSAQPQSKRSPSKNPAPDPPPPALSVPFRAGEKLEYRGGWQFYDGAATLKLAAVEQREFAGRSSWHFQALATTLNPLRYIFVLDDQFDSYSEAAGITSLQYEQYIREQNKHEDRISRMGHEGEPAPSNGPVVRVPAGTRDPLGAVYFLRTVNWARTPTVTMPVFDGKKLYEVRARLAVRAASAAVPAGVFTASRIDLRIFERGREVTTVRISLWIANDAARTPVRFEAELPFGPVRAELSRAAGRP